MCQHNKNDTIFPRVFGCQTPPKNTKLEEASTKLEEARNDYRRMCAGSSRQHPPAEAGVSVPSARCRLTSGPWKAPRTPGARARTGPARGPRPCTFTLGIEPRYTFHQHLYAIQCDIMCRELHPNTEESGHM